MNRRFLDDLSLAMADVYAAVTDQLLVNLARHFKLIKGGKVPGSWDYQVRKLAEMGQVTKESRDIILKMLGDADGALKNVLEQAIMDGLKDADPILRKAAEKGFITGVASGLAPNQMQAFQMYYQQSSDKLNLVNTVMLESTQQAYQSTVADIVSKIDTTQKILNTATGEIITGVDPFNKVLRQSVRKMVKNGLTGFIDHGGHHWSPEAYVAMDMRTTMTNTAREAVAERSMEMGCDLYQVSSHNGARPLCYPWQGKVISRNGWTGVVEDFDGNKITVHSEDEIESFRYGGGLFGVNCGHYPIPFVPGFSRSRPPQQDEEANAKEYAESQEQRRLERELRGEKRELAVMKVQGATEEEITAQKARITQANNNLDSFCDSTGRARRREREYTPINATWPDDYKQTYYERGTIRRNPLNQTTNAVQNVAQNATQQTAHVVQSIKAASLAKDFDELETYMSTTYGIGMDAKVRNLDFSAVREAMEGVERVQKDFPEVTTAIQMIETSGSGVMACNNSTITFNPKYFTDRTSIDDAIKRMVQQKWWPDNTSVASIGSHETAHAVEGLLIEISGKYQYQFEKVEAWNKGLEAKEIVSEAVKTIKKTAYGKGRLKADLIRGISGYATDCDSETLAEAFADYVSNGKNANPLSQEIYKLTHDKYLMYMKRGSP